MKQCKFVWQKLGLVQAKIDLTRQLDWCQSGIFQALLNDAKEFAHCKITV